MSFVIQEILSSVVRLGSNKLRNIKIQSLPCSTNATKIIPQQNSQPAGRNLKAGKPLGQPVHFTHPHRLLEGEVIPGIRKEEFRARRFRLLDKVVNNARLRSLKVNSHLIVIPSSHKKYMTEKIPYVFRQNTEFLYLTGCMEPDCTVVLTVSGNNNYETTLFLRGKDPHAELWDGPRTGVNEAVELFGVEKSLPMSELDFFLSSFTKENRDCMLWYDFINEIHPVVHKKMNLFLAQVWSKVWESPKGLIDSLRVYKSPAEQDLMRKASAITCKAIKSTMKNSRPGDNESQIWARVDYECRMNGAEYLAYPPVVAGGNRANTIHYINNDQIVKDGELVLMDAGCEYHSYTSDVSRTWPINGKFTPAQRELYEVVYSVQTELLRMCSTFPSLDHLLSVMYKLLGERLKEAGVFSNKVDFIVELSKVVQQFCPHHVGHYLGMDLHDTYSVPRNIPLEPGMVFTVEPGVYIQPSNIKANPKFHGLGIRIEDDVLMTNNGPVVLTLSCPKHPDDIEKLISESDQQ